VRNETDRGRFQFVTFRRFFFIGFFDKFSVRNLSRGAAAVGNGK